MSFFCGAEGLFLLQDQEKQPLEALVFYQSDLLTLSCCVWLVNAGFRLQESLSLNTCGPFVRQPA